MHPPLIRFGKWLSTTAFLVLLPGADLLAQEERLTLFDFWKIYSDAPNALYKDFVADALERLDDRAEWIKALRTRDDWIGRQEEIRRTLMEIVGPFPEKTPLNPRVLSVHRKEGYRVENVIYESQPGFLVTASLFIPDRRQDPAPAILYCSGHSVPGYRIENYQRMILNLVKKGFIVLAFDPIGQGERLQYFDPETGTSRFAPGSTRGHVYAGTQNLISGFSLARLMIWDGIRSVDYLLTREEVDPARLGITGRSGGGTQTSYITAFDDRLTAAAPENYLTTFKRLLLSRGPQDAEQNFYRGIASGIDQTDLLIAIAPKPALIVATTRDIFSYHGTLDLFDEAGQAYRAFGQPDALRLVSDDEYHAPTPKNREAINAFFMETLGVTGDPRDENVELLDPDELRVTPTGMVSTSFDEEDVLSITRRETARLIGELDQRRQELDSHLLRVRSAAARLSGHQPTAAARAPIYSGRYVRDGYFIEKHLIPVNPLYAIPVLTLMPEGAVRPQVVLYFHPEGKSAAAIPGGMVERLVKHGYRVVAPDIKGIGELYSPTQPATGSQWFDGVPLREWFGFVQMGGSIVGAQSADVMRTIDMVRNQMNVTPDNLFTIAHGMLGPLVLHVGAIEAPFAGVALLEPLISYRALATSRFYLPEHLTTAVPMALTAYDLPDLAASLAPRKLLMVNVSDPNGAIAGPDILDEDLAIVHAAYGRRGTSPSRFTLLQEPDGDTLMKALLNWLDQPRIGSKSNGQ